MKGLRTRGFLVSYVTPVMMLFADWIKSRLTGDVKAAIDRQRAKLTSEGYNVVEVTSDTEGGSSRSSRRRGVE